MNASFGPFLVIGLGLIFGFFFRRTGRFGEEAPGVLNAYVIGVALPGLVLSQLPGFLRQAIAGQIKIDRSILFLPVIPWLLFFAAIRFFGALYRMNRIKREYLGILALSGGLGNTAFVGFPLIEATIGREHLPLAILLDQLGTFLALSVVGTLWISIFREGKKPRPRKVLRDLFSFPPFLALLAAAVASVFPAWSEGWQTSFDRIGGTLIPVAMVSVGAQLKLEWKTFRREQTGLLYGLGFKMILSPLLIFLICRLFLRMTGPTLEVAVLEAGMAPMITSTVLGMEAGFAPDLGALMLGIGIPLSLVSVPLIHCLLR